MKAKTNNRTGGKFPKEIDSFIPTSWKLIDLVFKSLAHNHYADYSKSVIPIDCDGVVLDKEFLEVDFAIAVDEVFKDACQSCSKCLPYEIYGIKEQVRVLDALQEVAADIIDNYNRFCGNIPEKEDEVRRKFGIIKDNCVIIKELLSDRMPNVCKEWDAKSFFLRSDMCRWHGIINGKCIENIEYSVFAQVLNNIEEDFACVLTPLCNYGMAMYAFILLLMIKRYVFATDNQRSNPCEDYEYYNRCWAKEFSRRIKWRKDYYCIIEDSWKEYYITDECVSAPNNVTEEEKRRLSDFLGRKVFNEIVSEENFELILKGYSSEVSFDIYRKIYLLKIEIIKKLYVAVEKELSYLYYNLDAMRELFLDESEAVQQQGFIKIRSDDRRRNDNAINATYALNEDIDCKMIHSLFFINAFYPAVYKDQPIIYSEIVHEYIKNCIIQAEKIKMILSQKKQDPFINGVKGIRIESSKLSFEEDMKDFLNSKNEILTYKNKFARALVKKGYVDPPEGETWKEIFSHSRWQELLSPGNTIIENDELIELTRKLRWDKYDKRFSFHGTLQTKKALQQAFADKDYNNKQRLGALKELYRRVISND